MKKSYNKPSMEIERFELTQQLTSCGAIKIHFLTDRCVLTDVDAPDSMKSLAYAGFFMDGCTLTAKILEDTDGVCYNTAINLAFSS